jgi:hypothetical protein
MNVLPPYRVSRAALVVACVVLGYSVAVGLVPSAQAADLGVRQGCVAPPAAPTEFGDQVNGTTVSYSWQPSAGAAGYMLDLGSAPGASDVGTVSMTATSYAVTTPVGTYYVRVRAVSSCGSSAPSMELVVYVGRCADVPATPTGLDVEVSGTTMAFSWQPSAGATGYLLDLGTTTGASDVGTFSMTSTSHTLTIGVGTYYVRVRAIGACGSSEPSTELDVYVVAYSGRTQMFR